MHPHNLHARAAAWSLHHARKHLADAVERERAQQAAETNDAMAFAAAMSLQAWRPLPGRSQGVHGDPVGSAIAGVDHAWSEGQRPATLARLAIRVDQIIYWLTRGLTLTHAIDLLPRASPAGAAKLGGWLAGLDREVRDALQLDPAEVPADGNPECPACGLQLLHRLVAMPEPHTVCRADLCLCAGDACPCAMPIKQAGVVHIWEQL